MALAVGQTSKGSTTGGTTATTSAVTTATSGSTFEVAVIYDGTSFTSIADSKSNTYTQVGTETTINGSNAKCRRYKCEGGAGGASHTVTVTAASGIIVVLFMEVTGSTVVSEGTPSQAQDNASPFTSPSITTGVADTLLTSVIFGDSGSNPASTSDSTGFTVQVSELDGSTLWVAALATRAVTSTGTYNSSFTQTGTTNSVVGILAWKETGGSSDVSITAGLGQAVLTGYAPSVARSGDLSVTPDVGALAISSVNPRVQNSSQPSAISYLGSATGTTSATIPTHQAGDLIIAFAYRDGSNTIPTIPTGQNWTTLFNTTGANTNSHVVVYKKAASSGEATGTFTSATSVVVHVYRGVQQSAQIGGNASGSAASTTVAYNTLTMTDTTGRSWIVGFSGHRSVNTTLETAPQGMTNRATTVDATDEAAGHDTNGGVSSWATTNVSVGGTSSGWRSHTVEILSGLAFQPDYAELILTGHAPTVSQAGGGVSISPGLGALTITGYAPAVVSPVRISAGLGQLTFTGYAPSIGTGTGNVSISAGLGQLSFTGYAPEQTLTLASPPPGVLVLAGHAPTLKVTFSASPGVGLLTLTGLAPTVTATAKQFVSAGLGQLTITGYAPTVQASAPGAVSTGLGQLTLTGLAPSVFLNDTASIVAGLGALTFTGLAPTVQATANVGISAGLGALTLIGLVPAVTATAKQFASPDVGALEITGFAPTIQQAGSFTVSTGLGILEILGLAPSVSNSGDVVISRGGLGGPVRRNYIIKGKRYLQVTNEELAYLLARDMVDVARDDIKVVYKKSKPHKVSVNAWKELQDAFKLFDKPATDIFDDDEEAAMLLL